MPPGVSGQVAGWGRRRLLIGLAVAVAVVALLVVGLTYAVYSTVSTSTGGTPAGPSTQVRPSGELSARDRIAAAPMLSVTPADARPTTPAATIAPTMVVPAATRTGPVGVASGFPRTPEGAVGQLAAVEVTVLQTMSVRQSVAVYDGWALPGGVGSAGWELTSNVQAFLGAAQMGPSLDVSASVIAVPAAGQVKGVDGPDWVVVCVLLDVRATITGEARMGYGHCERMQWQHGRWMIAPGTPPATAPSTWPGSELAGRAGWRSWAAPGSAEP